MKPTQKQLDEPQNHVLPCDVWVNHICFKKGVKLSTLADSARRWHDDSNQWQPEKHKLDELRRLMGNLK